MSMKEFLLQQAECEDERMANGNQYDNSDWKVYDTQYAENEQPEALDDSWLDKGVSYIWKVAVLSLTDSNKCDFLKVYVATQRNEESEPEYHGVLYFSDGENNDVGRVIKRAVDLMKVCHPVYDDN